MVTKSPPLKSAILSGALPTSDSVAPPFESFAESSGDSELEDARQRLVRTPSILAKALLERQSVLEDVVAAFVSGDHVCVIGPPGVAKSMMARAMARAIGGVNVDVDGDGDGWRDLGDDDISYFEYLLTPFTEPNEIFGAIDVEAFKKGHYIRQIEGMLPSVNLAFLDETFKANSAILNSLLTILNERKYHQGRSAIHVPLRQLIMASNELPQTANAALWDRCLVRHVIKPLEIEQNRVALLENTLCSVDAAIGAAIGDSRHLFTLRDAELLRVHALNNVAFPSIVSKNAIELFTKLKTESSIEISDRRIGQVGRFLRVCAALAGASEVSVEMLERLSSLLWNDLAEIETINVAIEPYAARWRTQLKAASASYEALLKKIPPDDATLLRASAPDLGLWARELRSLTESLDGYKEKPEVAALVSRLQATGLRLKNTATAFTKGR